MPLWRVEIIRSRLEWLGSLEADTEEQAVDAAAKVFKIEPARRSRIVVTRVPDAKLGIKPRRTFQRIFFK